jgi:hypothetical protein
MQRENTGQRGGTGKACCRKQKVARVRAGKTEGRTDSKIGEQPLYANQYLRTLFRFLSWGCV